MHTYQRITADLCATSLTWRRRWFTADGVPP